jgi:multidrug efflux pump subunit AcrA (membrane-fusion protein)
MATTAVVAGTATVVSKGVSNSMDASAQQKAAAQQQQAAQQQAQIDAAAQQAVAQQQAALAAQQQQLAAAAPPAAPAPTGMTDEKVAQLKSIAELKAAGILTDGEFEVQKAKILAS